MWKNFIRDYLTFTKRQRKGLFILLGIILLCKAVPLLFPCFVDNKEQEDEGFSKAVSHFMALQRKPDHQNDLFQKPARLFPFDPNKIGLEEWLQLGVSKNIATIIQHYREAGGHFYKKEDLKKIYGLSDSVYERLAPYIQIEQPEHQQEHPKPKGTFAAAQSSTAISHEDSGKYYYSPPKRKFVIDINRADSAGWSRLYGIGPVLSARIVRFRKALGGFCKIDQIAEVYGLPDSTFKHIKKQLNISNISLKKLNINTASVEKLKSHPYINYRLAKAIKAFREMHGNFDSLPELKELQLVDDQIYRKLVPYISLK